MEEKYTDLKSAIHAINLVDSHAHNIISFNSTFPFLRCFTEAEGDALSYAPHSLSFKRSIRDIAELYGCEKSMAGIEAYRRSNGLDSITSKCFEGSRIEVLLIDDGIEMDGMFDVEWHKGFVPIVGRIIRIEHLAENILNHGEIPNGSGWTLDSFTEIFVSSLKSFADKAVAMKSIAAYRTGLDIDPCISKKDAADGLSNILRSDKPVRIQNKSFIDYIFIRSLEVAICFDLPVQLHTGFGDKDLDLRMSNPLHLRSVLDDERFCKCNLVLLHASYPFCKEASYLASVYPQVYLDFGLAVPKLSVYGMVSSVKELLELAPLNKVMFSTDGYAFPETFYLGAKRAREVLYSALRDACEDGDLTIPEAVEAAENIFKKNSVRLYKLDGVVSSSAPIGPHNSVLIENKVSSDDIVFIRIMWVDTAGLHRCRAIQAKRFYEVVKKNGVGLTMACMALLSGIDAAPEETNLSGVGEIRLIPDLSTKWRIPWTEQEEMVLADMQIRPGEAWEYCPRETLRRVSKVLKDEFNLEMEVGFENEFYLMRNVSRDGKEDWAPFDSTTYCSTSAFDAASTFLKDVSSVLQSLKISVEQFHAEAGSGQFEIALGHTACNHAADNLVFTREAIRAVARKHGLLATFLPKYYPNDIGSGAHVHVSLLENGKNIFMASDGSSRYGMSKAGEEFMAGVFSHLPSILAFVAPHPNSYDRIQPNTWSGAYHCWGKENREAPLRTACPPGISDGLVSNFELKSFDGCANPHLGLASILAAGIDGLRRHLSLPEPIDKHPSAEGGFPRLPTELSQSVAALEKDSILKEFIGEKLVTAVIGVRKGDIDYYSKNKDAIKKLIHQY
ncbi:glutamine synthetase [Ranunculus cassubicifolius]